MLVRLSGWILVPTLMLSLSLPVAARQPIIETIPLEPITVPASVCGFPVLIELYSQGGTSPKIATFFDKQGNVSFQLVSGASFSRLTNLTTGTTIPFQNTSGPARFVPQPDGTTKVTVGGGSGFISAPGLPPLAFVRGHVEFVLDAAGNIIRFDALNAQVQDVCALLS